MQTQNVIHACQYTLNDPVFPYKYYTFKYTGISMNELKYPTHKQTKAVAMNKCKLYEVLTACVVLKGATSRLAHLEKFRLNFSSSFLDLCNPC